MAEFNLTDFIEFLRAEMYKQMPYDAENDGDHMRDKAFMVNPVNKINDNTFVFVIGNEESERKFPHYHILEDAEVISKRGKGTKQTKGSQDTVADLGKRDYGRIAYKLDKNGNRSIFYEYRKNVRGKRSKVQKAQRYAEWQDDGTNKRYLVNRESKYYVNIHYHYIERMLDGGILDALASHFGLKRKRTQITDTIEEEFKEQIQEDNKALADLYANVDLKLPF